MGNYLRGQSAIITKERADSIRPILEWIKGASTRKKIRIQAATILREIEGIKDYKQVILTKGETDLLNFIYTEFPEGSKLDQQLKLL